jgi:hypothetical protein
MAYGDFVISVGEEVGIVRRHSGYGTLLTAMFATVTKINGHGHIFVQWDNGEKEMRFTRTGDAYKNDHGPRLTHAASLRAEIARENQRKAKVRLAREMEQELKNGWSYSGTFHVNKERLDTLKNILAEMEKLVDNETDS